MHPPVIERYSATHTKKRINASICIKMDETRGRPVEQNKPDIEEQKPHVLPHMLELKFKQKEKNKQLKKHQKRKRKVCAYQH